MASRRTRRTRPQSVGALAFFAPRRGGWGGEGALVRHGGRRRAGAPRRAGAAAAAPNRLASPESALARYLHTTAMQLSPAPERVPQRPLIMAVANAAQKKTRWGVDALRAPRASCLSVGTRAGFKIYNCHPFGKCYSKSGLRSAAMARAHAHAHTDTHTDTHTLTVVAAVRTRTARRSPPRPGDGAIGIAEMLFCTSLVAQVGAGEQPSLSPRRLQLTNTKAGGPRACQLCAPRRANTSGLAHVDHLARDAHSGSPSSVSSTFRP